MQSYCLDPSGQGTDVVTGATGTGTSFSLPFTILGRPTGGTRNLWLQSKVTSGTVSALVVSIQQSFDNGATWQTIEAGIDLVNAPSQLVSPPVSPGAVLQIDITTFTGSGTPSADIIASSN